MSNSKKISLKKAILAIENPYPKDDSIITYSDFLKHRDFLYYYQFNPVVLDNLILLCLDLWTTQKRISRLSLLENIKSYLNSKDRININGAFYYHAKPAVKLASKTRTDLFKIFKKAFEEIEHITILQRESAKTIVNSMLMNMGLSATEEIWLIDHISDSNHILNRVLRYPLKSEIISQWAIHNFLNNKYRNRRAEVLSWVLDETPHFVIEKQTLIDDFDYCNFVDKKAIKHYHDELEANEAIGKEFGDFFPKIESNIYGDPSYGNESIDLTQPELKLTRRFYNQLGNNHNVYDQPLPSFEMMHNNFHSNLDVIHCITMIWGIGYSRLKNELKTKLIKNYYREETYNSMLKVAKKNKNVSLLKWLMEQS
jgi:hypothetical protein